MYQQCAQWGQSLFEYFIEMISDRPKSAIFDLPLSVVYGLCVCVYPFIFTNFLIVRSYDLLVQHQYYKVFERE